MTLRALAACLLAVAAACRLAAADIAVVYPERSVAPGERAYAKALAGHLGRWYGRLGIETDLVADGALGGARGHRLIFLVDCYSPPAEVLAAIRAKRAGGARFVVCYSGSAELAGLFGLRAGAYVREPGRCREMAFAPDAVAVHCEVGVR